MEETRVNVVGSGKMATESLLPNGGSTGGSWAAGGTATNLWDGINNGVDTADDAEYDVISGTTEDVLLTLDLVNSALEDGDTVTDVAIRVRAGGADADDGITVDLAIGGTGQGVVSQSIGVSVNDYNLSNVAWDTDWTAAQLDGAQVLITNTQAGMPTSSTWTIYEVEVVITYTPDAGGPAGHTEFYKRMMTQ